MGSDLPETNGVDIYLLIRNTDFDSVDGELEFGGKAYIGGKSAVANLSESIARAGTEESMPLWQESADRANALTTSHEAVFHAYLGAEHPDSKIVRAKGKGEFFKDGFDFYVTSLGAGNYVSDNNVYWRDDIDLDLFSYTVPVVNAELSGWGRTTGAATSMGGNPPRKPDPGAKTQGLNEKSGLKKNVYDFDLDGEFEDLTGDGRVTVLDVAEFLTIMDRNAVSGAAELGFDFKADGELNITDVAALLEET